MSDVIETASSARSKCRRCQQKIDKGELRFGERVPNAFGEGEATQWFHLACAAEKRPDKLLAAVDAHAGEPIPDVDRIRELARVGAENPKLGSVLRAEPAPTSRASCQQCREKIEKGKLRIALEREAEPGSMASTSFIHVACAPEHLGTAGLLSKLLRTSPDLSDEQTAELKSALS